MTSTVNLYYDYVIRGLSRREFLDALATEEDEESDAVVDDVRGNDRDRGDCDAPADLDAVLKESPNDQR